MSNKLYLLVGPSGSGKNTLLELLLKDSNIRAAVSTTTRLPRPGEVDGKDYYFVLMSKFMTYIDQHKLLQYVTYSDNYYGLLNQEISDKLNNTDVIALVEPIGARQLINKYPEAETIFLRPASKAVLVSRMLTRGDKHTDIDNRMKTYDHFMSYMPEAKYIVNSETPEHTLEDVRTIIKRNR